MASGDDEIIMDNILDEIVLCYGCYDEVKEDDICLRCEDCSGCCLCCEQCHNLEEDCDCCMSCGQEARYCYCMDILDDDGE